MNRKIREHIESLEATLKMRNEYIAEQNEANRALKAELEELKMRNKYIAEQNEASRALRAELEELKRSAQRSTDEDVAQTLRNTILAIAGNVQNIGAAGYCNIATAMAMQTRRYTTTDLMRAVEAYAAFKATKGWRNGISSAKQRTATERLGRARQCTATRRNGNARSGNDRRRNGDEVHSSETETLRAAQR